MNQRLRLFFRGYIIVLLVALLWAIWSTSAQTNSASAAPFVSASDGVTTNVVVVSNESALARHLQSPEWVQRLAVNWPFLRYEVLGNELWKYIFSLIYIFLAFYVLRFLDYLTRVWLKRLAAKTETKLDDLLLELLNGPVRVISFMIFLWIGLDIFKW